jgi:hypothetical protein
LLVADPSKLIIATGWKPQYTIGQTLADMLAFYNTARAVPPVRTM